MKQLQKQFVCIKRTSMHDVNLKVFDFDYDLTWWALLIDAHERVYSRFGGSGDADPASRLSVAGLKYTMRLVLKEHALHRKDQPPPAPEVVRPVDLFGMKGKCMHCHQVNENFYKQVKPKPKVSELDRLRFLPIPEDIGLTLTVDAGNRVTKVAVNSPAEKAGVRPGDVLREVAGTLTLSQGDVMWALRSAPKEGRLPAKVFRGGDAVNVSFDLPAAWNNPDLSWRRSIAILKK